jgi:hypothetical protein
MFIKQELIEVLKIIYNKLINSNINWVLTGSFSFAIRGLETNIGDIDIQTDSNGAYEIEKLFKDYIHKKVEYKQSENIRSRFGSLRINGINIEIMGDIEKKLDNMWTEPPNLKVLKEIVNFEGMNIPVLSLEYEADAYLKMGRNEKAKKIKELIKKC